MASVNRIILLGNLGNDPDSRFTPSGDQITRISLATTWGSKDKSETTWHRVVFFGKTAETAAKYLKKGSQVYVEGRIQTSKFTGKDGVERYNTDIIADRIQLMGSKDSSQQKGKSDAPFTNDKLDDIPW